MIFEPFYPVYGNSFFDLNKTSYMPQDYEDGEFYKKVSLIMSGRIKNRWVDNANQFINPKGRVVKSIRANLFLKWIKLKIPHIPIVYIIRHPCAVVSSRIKLNWSGEELSIRKSDEKLINEYLKPFYEIMVNAKNPIQVHACL